MVCSHMNCAEADLPAVRGALDAAGPADVAAAFEPCPWCHRRVLCVESPRPDDRPRIRAALTAGGFTVPDASGHRNEAAVRVDRPEAFDPRTLT